MTAVYVFHAPDLVASKIGIAVDPVLRLQDLQTGSPVQIRLHWHDEFQDAFTVEQLAHKRIARFRLHGEWFQVDPETAVQAVLDAYESELERVANAVSSKHAVLSDYVKSLGTGGQTKLANMLGCAPALVCQWLSQKKRVTPAKAQQIERLSGGKVKKEALIFD